MPAPREGQGQEAGGAGFAWSFGGAPPPGPAAAAGAAGAPESAGAAGAAGRAPREGDLVAGRYALEALLGRGGAGAVWRALDRDAGRRVALKVLTAGLDPGQRARFAREGELTATLVHPGIVRVHAAGEHGGRPWIAYELVEGGTTAEEALPRLDRAGRVALVRDVARAVGFAHARGVVHRDLKPQNVLVGADGRARVADFGLARAEGSARLTGTGALVGTPLFMAPEQFGTGAPVGPPADVWALGVMLYEALTGALPFAGASLLDLGARVARARPTAPRALDPTVSAALEAVTLRALARAPEDRYPDAEALAQDLDAALAGRAPAALAAGARPPRGSRALLAAAALVVLGAQVGVYVARGGRRGGPRPAASPARPLAPSPAADLAAAEAALRGAPLDPAAWRAATRARLALGRVDEAAAALEGLRARAAWVEGLRAEVDQAQGRDPLPRLARAAAAWPDDLDAVEAWLAAALARGDVLEVAAALAARPGRDARLRPLEAAVRAALAADGPALRACGPALAAAGARWLVDRARRDVAVLARPPSPRPRGPLGGPPGVEPPFPPLAATARAARARAALTAALVAAPEGPPLARAWLTLAELEGPATPAGRVAAAEAARRADDPWLRAPVGVALAEAHLAAGQAEEALSAAIRGLVWPWPPGRPALEGRRRARRLAGEGWRACGRDFTALHALGEAAGPGRDDPRAVELMAQVRGAHAGRVAADEAAALAERAARLRGARREEADVLVHRARHLMKREAKADRAAVLDEALALDPLNPAARYHRGFLGIEDLDFAPGFRVMLPALRDAPWLLAREAVENMNELGRVGRGVEGGRSTLGPVLAGLGTPGAPADRDVRGFVAHALVEYEAQPSFVPGALLDLGLHLADDPGDVVAWGLVGFLELRAGRLVRADDAVGFALEAAPDVGTFHLYRALVDAARGAPSAVVATSLERGAALGHPALLDLTPYPELLERLGDPAFAARVAALWPEAARRAGARLR